MIKRNAIRARTFAILLPLLTSGSASVTVRAAPSLVGDFFLDNTESYLTLSIPNFAYSGFNFNITGQNRSNGSPVTGAWTTGDMAFISGSFSTTIYGAFTPGGITAVQFISGSTSLTALDSGNYRPNPAAFNGAAQPPAYNDNSAAAAAYGGTIHLALGSFGNAGLFSLSQVAFDLNAASPLTVTGGQFPVNTLETGLSSATLSSQALSLVLLGPILPSVENSLVGLSAADLSAASATLTLAPNGDFTMTIPIIVPFSLSIGDGAYLNGTATGQLVARTDPEPPTLLLAMLGLGSFAVIAHRKRWARRD
jgi:hypothetical protein